jgi:AcrR family transcriptional regulator
MARKQRQDQRRNPRQARSRATWAAIIEAAAQVLERDGAAGFNTNSVAERAGVSIGTLYQYFPDKQAILAAAAKRELTEDSAAPAARRRALIEALIAMVEGLGRFGAAATSGSKPSATGAVRSARRTSGWERRCAEVLQAFAVLLLPQPTLQPIRLTSRRARRP